MEFNKVKIFVIGAIVLLSFSKSADASYSPRAGDLVKGSFPAVYYITSDNKRLAFPNETTYFSWYENFNDVKIISSTELAALPLAGLVTIRPGGNIVKIGIDPKIYAIAHGGVLRQILTPTLTQTIFGVDWSKKI